MLISGGIGVTPMLSMAYQAANTSKNVRYIYSTQSPENHSFKYEVNQLLSSNKNMTSTIFYTDVKEGTKVDGESVPGRIDKEWIEKNLDKNSEFYFCGPLGFMKSMYHGLIEMGVDKERIHFELFNSAVDITK